MKEVWRQIPGFPYYDVSNLGNVRSWKIRNGTQGVAKHPHPMKPVKVTGKKYYHVCLVDSTGTKIFRKVHHLVLTAFVCPRPEGCEGCHNDDDQSNNALYNLRWDTPESNVKDKIANGKQAKGEDVKNSKLTEAQVREIIQALPIWKRGMGRMFARKFGVSDAAISLVKTGTAWRHI